MPGDLRPRKARHSYTALFGDEEEEEDEQEQGPSRLHHNYRNIDRDKDRAVDDDDSTSDFTPPAPEDAPALSDENGSEHGAESNPRGTKKTQTKKKGTSQGKGKGKGKGKDTTTPKAKTKGKGKGKQKEKGKEKATPRLKCLGPATPRRSTAASTAPTTRQNYALPNPNIHHRHRPVPLFRGPTATAAAAASASLDAVRVERLLRTPLLFAPNETVPTNAYASTLPLTSRVGKAWGASIGAGPVWQIVEDLGWFREAEKQTLAQVQVYDERTRRPRVHADVAIPLDHDGPAAPIVLSAEYVSPFLFSCSGVVRCVNVVVRDGIAYMPTDGGPTTAAAPPVSCDFGPFGEQSNVNLETLEALKLCKLASGDPPPQKRRKNTDNISHCYFVTAQFFPESRAYAFNAGASVWGLDWCPIHPDDRPRM
jgi:transcription factor C subunit 6